MKNKENLIIYGTVLLLFVPAMLSNIGPEISVSILENRPITGFPPKPTSLEQFYKWPSKFDEFIKTHFYMRSTIIHQYSKFYYRHLGLPINQNVIIGKKDWLYISKNDHAIDKYRGIYTFTNETQKQNWINELNRQASWIKNKEIDFIFVIIPSKPTVYPEYLPEQYSPIGPTITDTVVELLRKDANFKWVDLRPTLTKAARNEKVFFEHDTHWNDRGSYVGYLEVMETIEENHPVNFLAPSDISFQMKSKEGGDLTQQLGLHSEFHEETPFVSIKKSTIISKEGNFRKNQVLVKTSNRELPKALILCDSFVITYMSHFLQESFSSSLYKNHYGLRFNKKTIEEFSPDIVLVMITERLIPVEIKK